MKNNRKTLTYKGGGEYSVPTVPTDVALKLSPKEQAKQSTASRAMGLPTQVTQVTQATQETSKKIIKPSVVYSDNLKDGNGAMIKSKVIKQLNKSGIYTVITGHKPHGDCPLVIRNKNLIAISADISYSNVNNLKEQKIISHDTRGSAVCEVLLYFNGDIRVHGILANKNKYNFECYKEF
jgi:hypothetical protein